jgi:cytochrome b6-f complex iron-sulfur subunit
LIVVISIILIFVVAAITVAVLANRSRSSTGGLSRETRARDKAAAGTAPEGALSTSTELEAAGRERSEETQQSHGLVRRRGGAVVEYEPVDEEELGVTRRQFLNRGLLTAVGFAAAGFAPAMLAFLWPLQNQPGFGGKVTVDATLDDIKASIASEHKPFYVAEARTYIELYPKEDIPKGEAVYPPVVIKAMESGIVALYQKCVHLGCRVPFCESSQFFECPCHGSKYNRVGEKTAGPAPRGLDHWPAVIDGQSVSIDTGGVPIPGVPIGTDTTGQTAEGPQCV